MKNKSKLIAIIATILMLIALSLLLYRALELFKQVKSEMKIEGLYNMPTATHSFETAHPNAQDYLPSEISQTVMPQILSKFNALLDENVDTVGWLKLDDTRIDHVVLQGYDNIFYLEHDFFGNKSVSASMMLDSQCSIENIKGHYVIYGHRMKSGTMMNDILKYEKKEFFYDNPIIYFSTIYEHLQWEVFSTYCKDYNYNNTQISFDSQSQWLSYIQKLQEESIYTTDIILQSDDVVLTLYTCDYRISGGRYVLHARLMK